MKDNVPHAYSVLMTVYRKDRPDWFRLSLESMVQQTKAPEEIVIVKDGPIPAELQAIIDSFIGKGIAIQQIQLEKNVGLGLALNAGIPIIRTELIARMDADDYSLPERCEKELAEFQKEPELDIVGCPVLEFVGSIDNIVGERKVPLTNDEIYRFAKRRDPFNHPTVMYRKSAVEAVGGYSNYRKNQDTDLWIKLLSAGAVCKNLSEPLLRFRFDEETYQKRKSWLNTKILIEIRYRAWRTGFNSLLDFLIVACAQIGIYIMPSGIQRWIYKTLLRK